MRSSVRRKRSAGNHSAGRADQYQSNRFTIIGMFQHYESEEDVKKRNGEKPAGQHQCQSGPARQKGSGKRSGGQQLGVSMEKRHGLYPSQYDVAQVPVSRGSNNIPDPRLSSLSVKIRMSAASRRLPPNPPTS